MLDVLRRRDFTLVWFAGLISEIGDWLLLVGLPVYVYMLTNSELIMATVFILELVPAVVFGSLAGVLVDRWNRKLTMVVVAAAQGVLLLPLLAVHHIDQMWVVYLIAPLQSLLAQIFEPAKSAALPTLVPAEKLVTANSLIGLSTNVARLIGSSLGGLAVVSGSLTTVVMADSTTYLLSALAVALARFPAKTGDGSAAEQLTVLRAWWEGMVLIVGRRDIRNTLLSAAAASIAQGMFLVLFIIFVDGVLDGDSTEIGVLRGVQAIGGVIGGFAIAWVGARVSQRGLIAGGALSIGLLSLLTWNASYLTHATTLYVLLFIAIGIPGIANSVGLLAFLQQALPNEYLGRVMAAFLTVFGGCQALGMLLAGLISGYIDTVVVLNIQAGFYILAAVLAYFGLPRVARIGAGGTSPDGAKTTTPST
ncbi:MFS transporter [Nonomuraea insulae]|uniref:MFS transporter n=1 Tax=Nonomuraea insulae TaxID=1616787 RepID=A0ABW1D828_9ACTN